MSSPRWNGDELSDDELLAELRAALREPPDDSVVRAAEAAFSWRTVDADLELLSLDTSAWLTAGAPVRGGDPVMPRTLVFRGERRGKRLSVEVEIDDAGISGQLIPPQPGQVTLVTAAGPQATTVADEVGCFAFPAGPSGPLRLECHLDTDRFVTEWVTA
ncbi:MAG TPA: hypothetical protein VGI74_01570 [Streptosporangiaceae bacterium]